MAAHPEVIKIISPEIKRKDLESFKALLPKSFEVREVKSSVAGSTNVNLVVSRIPTLIKAK